MKYKSFRIKNFKGIEEVDISFHKNRILTLVGLNESGKTTILAGIKEIHDLIKGKKPSKQNLNRIRPKSVDFSDSIILSTTLELEDDDIDKINKMASDFYYKLKLELPKTFTFTYQFDYNLSEFKNLKESREFVIKHNLNRNVKGLNDFLENELIQNIKRALVPEVLYYEDFIFEIPDRVKYTLSNASNETVADVGRELKNAEWQNVFNDILQSAGGISLDSFQRFVVDKWVDDNDTARQRLSSMEKQLDKKITKAWKQLFDNKQSNDQRLNFKEIKIVPNLDPDNVISFSFKVKTEDGWEFSINERSKGCKWFFSFLIFTEFRKKRSKNILFLLDEPASNLHSSAQLKILSALDDLSQESVVVYSTHSHHLINPLWLNGAYVVLNEGITDKNLVGDISDAKTAIKVDKYFNYVSNTSQEEQRVYYQPIFDMLQYKCSLVEIMPQVVICEGKNDWYTYKYIFEIILKKKGEVNLYPGKGRTKNSDTIRFLLSWGHKFIVFLDGDKPSIDSKKEYLKEFNDYISPNIYTIKDVIDEQIATEDIFSKKDVEHICNKVFGDACYASLKNDKAKLKSKFNNAISILLNTKEEIVLEDATLKKFEAIYSFLHQKMLALA